MDRETTVLKKPSRLIHVLNQFLFALGRTHPITGPLKAFWEITYRCNSRCLNCDIWKRKSVDELSTEQAVSILRQLKQLSVPHISFSGGEVFLRKDFFEVMAAAHDMGFKYSINTNASLLDDERCRKLGRMPPESIYISLDGARSEIHDKIRGVEGAFDTVMTAVDRLNDHRDPGHMRVYFNTTINKLNIEELPAIAELAIEKKIDGMTMSVVQNVDGWRPLPEMLLDASDIGKLMSAVEQLLEKHKELLPHIAQYFRHFKEAATDPGCLYRYRCVAGYLMLMIHPNGDVFSCPVAFEKVGNAAVEPLNKIWYKNFRELRRRVKAGRHPICWFDCVAPINIIMSYIHPLRIHHLFDRELLGYLKHKI